MLRDTTVHMEDPAWPPGTQREFERALKSTRSLPPGERWAAVADLVPGKSKGECIARVRNLRGSAA